MASLTRRSTLAGAVLLAGLAVVGVAVGASVPRFYSTNPKPALARYELHLDHSGAFTDARCWLTDGNRKIGWRNVECVGNYNHSETTYRYKLVATARSCTRVRETVTVFGVGTVRKTVAWRHQTFACKR
jgi:hypothetical protein